MTDLPTAKTEPAAARPGVIRVRGARMHNLRNVNVDIPRGQLVVMTGVSGSGKSSLAFDTLFAEGQRRYLETLSAQTRTYLDQMPDAAIDDIDGLPPTLTVEQHAGHVHPRSTLATTTGIHEFVRLLYARAGTAHCPQCQRALSQQSPQSVVDSILALEAGRKAMILAPAVRGKKGQHKDLFEKIAREGFVRARVDGEVIDVNAPPALKKSQPHDIDVIIDRIVVKDGLRARLQESVELALRHGNGSCIVSHQTDPPGDPPGWQDALYSSRFACPACGIGFAEIEPRTFSFNSPYGACPTCGGLGTCAPPDVPASSDSDDTAAPCPDCHGARLAPIGRSVTVAGVPLHRLLEQPVATATAAVRELQDLVSRDDTATSPAAAPDSTEVPPDGITWTAVRELSPAARRVAQTLLPEIHSRLQFLEQVGLGYLTLDRPTRTLSGGEFHRARLAGCLGGGLTGVCYILDEPTAGLHPRDTARLLTSLVQLRDQGNSLIVVEHDQEVMLQADYLIDLGPGAGPEGGLIVACGTPPEIAAHPQSRTGRFLQQRLHTRPRNAPAAPLPDTTGTRAGKLTLSNVSARNLKNLTVEFPLGALTCVTGVSGSGKSTLVMEVLVPRLRAALASRPWGGAPPRTTGPIPEQSPAPAGLQGWESIQRLVEIDQSPLGRNSRSNPATASGLWNEIRRLFARTRDARLRGFKSARFSFNAAGGRCEACRGQGVHRVSMQFLPDLEVVCPACQGARFNAQTLHVRFRGKSVAQILDLRIADALAFFDGFAAIQRQLQTFVDVGLGYLTLGQSAATLSGGESQRIKLATELGGSNAGPTLYVLDEPTTGLHPADIERLLDLLTRLVREGHTVIVVEHALEVISQADWIIDLGPEGGTAHGGQLVATGPPAHLARHPTSHTGRALRDANY